jgi:hypothetical protein
MSYPTFNDRYGGAGQAGPGQGQDQQAGGGISQEINPWLGGQDPVEQAAEIPGSPWSKALNPWAVDAASQNPQPMQAMSGAKV